MRRDKSSREEKRERSRRQAARNPATLTQSLTPRTVKKEARAAAQVQYGPELRSLEDEYGISRQQASNIGNWYGQYQTKLEGARTATAQAYAEAQAALDQNQQAASQQDEQLRGRLRQEGLEDAELRGTTYDASGDETAVQAQLARRAYGDMFEAGLQGAGATQSAYLADRGRIAEGQKLDQLTREARVAKNNRQATRDLLRDRGAFLVDFGRQQRADERQWTIEQKAFGLKKREFKSTKKQTRKARESAKGEVRQERKDDARERRRLRLGGKQSRKSARVKARQSRKTIGFQGRQNKRFQKQKTRDSRSLINRNNSGGGSSGGGGEKKRDGRGGLNAGQRNLSTALRRAREMKLRGSTPEETYEKLRQQGFSKRIALRAVDKLAGTIGGVSPKG